MSQTADDTRIRQADLNDVDSVTDTLLASMPIDKEWWDYRFPFRHDYPEDHRRFMRVLVEAWLRPDFDDWAVFVAECPDARDRDKYRVVAYAAWDVSYRNFRRHGPDYKPLNPYQVVRDAGGSERRDTHREHQAQLGKAADEAHDEYFHAIFGTEHIYLQALGTHPDFQRRGLGSRLCRWGMQQAVQENIAMTILASPLGRGMYPRLGFTELGTILVQIPDDDKSTHMYPFAWDPRKPSVLEEYISKHSE